MPALYTALAVGSLALVPPVDVRVADAPRSASTAARTSAPPTRDCGRQLDPSFVHYVPPAPGSGRNPLLRLVSSPTLATGAAIVSPGRPMSSCRTTPLLTLNDDCR